MNTIYWLRLACLFTSLLATTALAAQCNMKQQKTTFGDGVGVIHDRVEIVYNLKNYNYSFSKILTAKDTSYFIHIEYNVPEEATIYDGSWILFKIDTTIYKIKNLSRTEADPITTSSGTQYKLALTLPLKKDIATAMHSSKNIRMIINEAVGRQDVQIPEKYLSALKEALNCIWKFGQ
jgi:hypothetical protein